MRGPFPLLLLSIALPACPGEAGAAVRRCLAEDGTTIYTDRPCEQFQARDVTQPDAPASTSAGIARPPPEEMPLASYGPAHADCARTPDALLFILRRTFENRDINALAGLYHWPGTGGRGANWVMNELENLLRSSDGSADLVYPEAAFVVHAPEAWPGLPAEDPIGVRLTPSAASDSPAATLRMIRHAGCWWVHF